MKTHFENDAQHRCAGKTIPGCGTGLTLQGLLPWLALAALVQAALLEWTGWQPTGQATAWWRAGGVGWMLGGLLVGWVGVPSVPVRRGLAGGMLAAGALLVVGSWQSEQILNALADRLPPAMVGVPVRLTGVIARLPGRHHFGEQILMEVHDCTPLQTRQEDCAMLRRVLLDWGEESHRVRSARADADRPMPWPEPGERWIVETTLRPPAAGVNPGAFDRERALRQQGIGALGRVAARTRASPAAGGNATVESGRAGLRAALERLPQGAARRQSATWSGIGLITALTVGEQGAVPAAWWDLFARTGVSHVMAISGAHVTLLAGVVVAALQWLMRVGLPRLPESVLHRLGLMVWFRPDLLAGALGIVMAFGYALLSGWGLPAQRTCWMLLAAWVMRQLGWSGSGRVTLVAAGGMAAFDVQSVASAGFWLSFGAVWILQASSYGRLPAVRWQALRNFVSSQWAVTVALTPVAIACFSMFSGIAPLANAVAIPWVGLVLTPLAFVLVLLAPLTDPAHPWLAMLATVPARWLLDGLLMQIDWLMAFLTWLDTTVSGVHWVPRPTPLILGAALCGAVLLLAPPGFPLRHGGLLLLLPLLMAPPRQAPADALTLTVFDLSRGASVLVEQGAARMLVDTGSGDGAAAGVLRQTVLPWLHTRGLDSIDTLVVTHFDRDHAGGAALVRQALGPARLVGPVRPEALGWPAAGQPGAVPWHDCQPGTGLTLGVARVTFHALPVTARRDWSDNAASCVLRIDSPAGSVVLAGDLPVEAERALRAQVVQRGETLAATVLVVPGQGSREGAGPVLLDMVRPAWAVVQVGRSMSRFHPHPELLKRLEVAGARVLRTDQDGALQMVLRAGQPPHIRRWRTDAPPWWRWIDPVTARSNPRRAPSRRPGSDRPRWSRERPPSRRAGQA